MKSNSDGKLRPKNIRYIILGLGLVCAFLITAVSIYMVNYGPKSKNERAIEAVMTSLLTCPDVELTQLMELSSLHVGEGFIEEPKVEDVERLNNKINDMFGPYVTEKTLGYIMYSTLRYHFIAEEKGSEVRVKDIEINQDKKDSRSYTFTVHLNYTSPNMDKNELIVNGRAQCLEPGKISFLRFEDDFYKNEFVIRNVQGSY